jgi:hypothetical protein
MSGGERLGRSLGHVIRHHIESGTEGGADVLFPRAVRVLIRIGIEVAQSLFFPILDE